jgi:hypothetical protein
VPNVTTTKRVVFNDGPWSSVAELEREAGLAGSHFFDADAKRFFRSKINRDLYAGRFFITSEQFEDGRGYRAARLYTVRMAVPQKGHGLAIEEIGGFQAFETLGKARTFARKLAAAPAVAETRANRIDDPNTLEFSGVEGAFTCRYWQLPELEQLARRLNRERKIRHK